MKRYSVSLSISVLYIFGLLVEYILPCESSYCQMTVLLYIIFPLTILYLLAFLILLNIKTDLVGWLIIGYTFAYYVCLLFYIATPIAYPPIRIEGTVFLSKFGQRLFWDGIKFIVLPAFIFNTLLFSLLKMKTHLIVSIVSTISSILLFIFTMQIYMGV